MHSSIRIAARSSTCSCASSVLFTYAGGASSANSAPMSLVAVPVVDGRRPLLATPDCREEGRLMV